MMIEQSKEQYASSNNLEARKNIYQYSIHPKTFSKWLTEQITPDHHVRILELGCGTGDLWKNLKGSFPHCQILLSDFSEGMLKQAKENLGEADFGYEVIDFHHIPYPDQTFDIVISNHNLYLALDLWKDLKGSFPHCQILLLDFSESMLMKAKENLGENEFCYEVIDFHHIPYPDQTFDIVISNHNLYLALDLKKVLGEISRVMKDGGVFYSTTSSIENMASLRELIGIADDSIWPNSVVAAAFGAETGIEILSHYFQDTDRRDYENELRIKDFAPIINYFMSVRDERVHQIVQQSMNTIQDNFETEIRTYGYFKVITKACLFICRKQRKVIG